MTPSAFSPSQSPASVTPPIAPSKKKNTLLFWIVLSSCTIIGLLVALVLFLLFRGPAQSLTAADLAAVDLSALPSEDISSQDSEPAVTDTTTDADTVVSPPQKTTTTPAHARFQSKLLPFSFVPPKACAAVPQEALFTSASDENIVRGTSYNAVLMSVGEIAAQNCPMVIGSMSANFYSKIARGGTPLDLIGFEYRKAQDELFLPVWWAKEDVSGYTMKQVKAIKTLTGETAYTAQAPSVFDAESGVDIVGVVALPAGTSPSVLLFYAGTEQGQAGAMREAIESLVASVKIQSEKE